MGSETHEISWPHARLPMMPAPRLSSSKQRQICVVLHAACDMSGSPREFDSKLAHFLSSASLEGVIHGFGALIRQKAVPESLSH